MGFKWASSLDIGKTVIDSTRKLWNAGHYVTGRLQLRKHWHVGVYIEV